MTLPGPSLPKLPGDGAPPVEPPPHLKERIMAVVRAEAAPAPAPGAPREIPATVSVSLAPAGEARLLVEGRRATLEARHLPAPPEGGAYRLWLLRGAEAPLLPEPGPELAVGSDGRGRWALGDLRDVHEIVVAVERSGRLAERRVLLRVRLAPVPGGEPGVETH